MTLVAMITYLTVGEQFIAPSGDERSKVLAYHYYTRAETSLRSSPLGAMNCSPTADDEVAEILPHLLLEAEYACEENIESEDSTQINNDIGTRQNDCGGNLEHLRNTTVC